MMDRIRDLFKSERFILLFSMGLCLVLIIFQNLINSNSHIEIIILSSLSLIWGPFAILGFVIIEFLNLMIRRPENLAYNTFFAIAIFISNAFIWKLWYSIMNKHGYEVPNLGRLYNFLKLLVIFIIHTIITIVLLSYAIGEVSIITRIIVLIPILIVTPIIVTPIINYFKIPSYPPRRQLEQVLPKKVYTALPVISILIFSIFMILDSFVELDAFFDIVIMLVVVSCMIYLSKPFEEKVFKIKDVANINLFNKEVTSIFLIVLILSVILITSRIALSLIVPEYHFADDLLEIYVVFFEFSLPIAIPITLYMYILEHRVIKPINIISNALSKETTNKKEYEDMRNKLKSIKSNNELQTLSESLLNMEDDLLEYRENLINITSKKERFETELKLGHDIQQSMIPHDFEEFQKNKNFEIAGFMKAAREVGGDFYDYFQIDDENIGFTIGDVSGKGITASLIMVKTMTLLEDYAKHNDDIKKVFYEVNNLLCEGNIGNYFITCWFGKLNIKTGELTFINAGHNHPLFKPEDNDFEYLDTEINIALGAFKDFEYESDTIQLKHSSLFLFTDGITEANDNYEGFYGEERLKNILNKHKTENVANILRHVEDDMNEFCNYQEQFDDTTMFIIRMD